MLVTTTETEALSHLWWWMEGLSYGILLTLNALGHWLGHWGWAVVLLSLVVKLAMWPLTALAERWQRQVNQIQSTLEPKLKQVKREYRGEAQAEQILALHRAHGVSVFYSLKSVFGLLVQIPVFIAAFQAISASESLFGQSFGFIADLSAPDQWIPLPGTELQLNLLPLLMTLLTLLAIWQLKEPSLSPALQRRQQWRLLLLALLFLALLYTFPAAAVLYWTCNNLWHYLKQTASRFIPLHWQTSRSST